MFAILFDETKCVGCQRCVEACVAKNKLPDDVPFTTSEGDGLSGWRRTAIVEVPDANRFVKKQCLHCLHPACESACIVGAMKKTPAGPVVYDAKKCIGCRYCMLACAVGTPRYQWNKTLPYIQKCDMCADLIAEGKKPACVDSCPHEALQIGERNDILKTARGLIGKEPDKYINHIYGEKELGGTCVLYITDTRLDDVLRFPAALSATDIPSLTWPVISKTPVVGLSVLSGLIGLYWIIERRMKIAAEEAASRGPTLDELMKKGGAK